MTSTSSNARARQIVDLLKEVPLFAGMPDDDLARLSLLITEKHYPRDTVVVSATDPRLSELEARDKQDAWLGVAWRGVKGQRVELEHRQGIEDREANARERGGRRRYHVTFNDIERAMTSLSWEAEWAGSLETQLRAYRGVIDVENRRTEGEDLELEAREPAAETTGEADGAGAAGANGAGAVDIEELTPA